MENERREDSPEPQRLERTSVEATPYDEGGRRDESHHEDRPARDFDEPRQREPHDEEQPLHEASPNEGPENPEYERGDDFNESRGEPATSDREQSSAQQGQGHARGGGRRRGGRRLSSRDRRMQGRNRRREGRPAERSNFQSSHGSGPARETHPRDERREDYQDPRRSLIENAKAEVDQIREALEGVLRDLENVSEQLTRAEHEKDIAEAEIEQLRDSLRRLHH